MESNIRQILIASSGVYVVKDKLLTYIDDRWTRPIFVSNDVVASCCSYVNLFDLAVTSSFSFLLKFVPRKLNVPYVKEVIELQARFHANFYQVFFVASESLGLNDRSLIAVWEYPYRNSVCFRTLPTEKPVKSEAVEGLKTTTSLQEILTNRFVPRLYWLGIMLYPQKVILI